ncbi:hypothetical protein [Humibacter albus]|uniref:hypothetical protein n=1 Tax=Humibacter albus TaxID=427754 RepID=UPI000A04AB25|nr:hypothetical protein [Humibacter albus]
MREDARARAEWTDARSVAHETARALAGRRPAAETVPLDEAIGRVLATDLMAKTDVPSAPSSAMDGWAVRGRGPWRVLGDAIAEAEAEADAAAEAEPADAVADPDAEGAATGGPTAGLLHDGEAAPVATGDPVPSGASAVLRRERGEVRGSILSASFGEPGGGPEHGADIRLAGEDARAGALLLQAGTVLNPAQVVAASICGYDEVTVAAVPGADILLVGDVSEALEGRLPALFRMLGLRSSTPRHVADDRQALRRALHGEGRIRDAAGDAGANSAAGPTADPTRDPTGAEKVTITVGGIGRSQSDDLRGVLRDAGAEFVIDGVCMRPGSPSLLVRMPDGRLIVALPGTPLAAFVGATVLLTPLVAGLRCVPLPQPSAVRLAEDVHDGRGRARMLPYVLTVDGAVQIARRGAAVLRGLGDADGLLVVPAEGATRGAVVPALSLPWTFPTA